MSSQYSGKRITSSGHVAYRCVPENFADLGPLQGFTALAAACRDTPRARSLNRALHLTVEEAAYFALGCLPDGRWALVGRTAQHLRASLETGAASGRRRPKTKKGGWLIPVEPLPEEQARAILRRLIRGLPEKDLLAMLGVEKSDADA